MEKISEYDAFGPWVYKIDEEHEVPAFFVPYVDENDGALFRMKVPKNIERRNASPDMNLYQQVISVFDDRLEVLTEQGRDVKTTSIDYSALRAVSIFAELLFGQVTLFLTDKSIDITYNTVSGDLMMEFVDIVRKGMDKMQLSVGNTGFNTDAIAPDFIYLSNVWNKLKKEERPFNTCAYQEPSILPVSGFIETMRTMWNKPRMAGTLHLMNSKEVIVFEQDGDIAWRYSYVPIEVVKEVYTGLETSYEGIKEAGFTAGAFSGKWMYKESNTQIVDHYQKVKELVYAN